MIFKCTHVDPRDSALFTVGKEYRVVMRANGRLYLVTDDSTRWWVGRDIGNVPLAMRSWFYSEFEEVKNN